MTSLCPIHFVFRNLNGLHAPEIWSEFNVLCSLNGKIELIQDLISACHIPPKESMSYSQENLGEAGSLLFLSKNGISPLEKPFIQQTFTEHLPGTVLGPGDAVEANEMNVVSALEILMKKGVSKQTKKRYFWIMIIMKEVSRDVMQSKWI